MRRIFISSLFILAIVVSAGFFIGQKSLAAEEYLIHNGNKEDHSDWQYQNCDSDLTKTYLILNSTTSSIVSPEIDLYSCISARLIFNLKAYRGFSASVSSSLMFLDILINDSVVSHSVYNATSTALSTQEPLELNIFCGQKIKLKFSSPNGTGFYGVGLNGVYLEKVLNIANLPPVAVATSSLSSAEINEEIFFDGSPSSDSDGHIIQWIWDLAGEFIYAPTTTKSFATTGTKPIYFWAVDDDLATSSPVFFNLEVIDSSTSTATTTVTTTPPVVNPGDLVINEIYPAPPTGEPEWLEIYNNTLSAVSLNGLYLLDAKFSTTTLSGEIVAGGYAVIENISGNLNNDGDTIILRSADQIISQTAYGDFSNKRDQSWARTASGDYAATIKITRGAINIIEAKPVNTPTGGGLTANQTPVEAVPTSTPATSTIAVDYKGKLVINEVFPNPAGSDDEEFIELKNISESAIELNGFYLSDNTNAKHLIKAAEKLIIEAGGLAVIRRASSSIALNNSGFEAINLYDAEGELLDRITYQAAKSESQSYAKNDNGEWLWTTNPTPGEENIFSNQAEIIAVATALVSKAKTSAKKTTLVYGLVELENLPDLADGAQVKVRGIVAVEPGVLGTQVFYLSGSGIQVYSYKKDFPTLKIGDYIEVSGELSTVATGRRLKTKTADDFKLIESRSAPTPHQLKIGEIGEEYANNLIEIEGEIIEIKNRSLIIAESDDELETYIKTTMSISDLNLKEGFKVKVAGILVKNGDGFRLLPRNLNDLQVVSGEVKGDFEQTSSPVKSQINYYLVALVVFLSLVVAYLVFKPTKNTP